jgi:hypothetical protein
MAVDFNLGTNVESAEFDVKGIGGAPGKSAYDLAVLNGYKGSLERWLAEVHPETRVTSLDDTLIADANVIKVVGIPVFVGDTDFEKYAAYGINETGWYAFVRIAAKPGVTASDATIEGAAGFILADDHVNVAVRYEVASMAKAIKITWGGETEIFVFEAGDLAIRNLDDRVTFYVYDVAKYTRWEFAPTEDTTFDAKKFYWLLGADGEYSPAEVTAGEAVPAIYYEDFYALTTDETFATGKTYYTLADGVYTAAEVTAGETVPADTYYEHSYVLTGDVAFVEGKTYYTKSGTTYTAATVTAGEDVPTVYYAHSKVIFEGMVRNVTYCCNTTIDCPMEFVLPVVEDEEHGCWFEIRCLHAGEYSMTLTPPSSDIKIATEHTQKEKEGINMINLHYTAINGVKVWRFLNTHSTIPA